MCQPSFGGILVYVSGGRTWPKFGKYQLAKQINYSRVYLRHHQKPFFGPVNISEATANFPGAYSGLLQASGIFAGATAPLRSSRSFTGNPHALAGTIMTSLLFREFSIAPVVSCPKSPSKQLKRRFVLRVDRFMSHDAI